MENIMARAIREEIAAAAQQSLQEVQDRWEAEEEAAGGGGEVKRAIVEQLRQKPALLEMVLMQMVLGRLRKTPKAPIHTRVATIELQMPPDPYEGRDVNDFTDEEWEEILPYRAEEEFSMVYSCAVDRRSGLKYVGTCTGIWKISPTLMPEIFVGCGGERRGKGLRDGVGTEARLDGPCGMVVDKHGNIFVIATNNHAVRKVTPEGVMTTIAGGVYGYKDGVGREAKFALPMAIAMNTEDEIIYGARARSHPHLCACAHVCARVRVRVRACMHARTGAH
jgi:hypothetical protein